MLMSHQQNAVQDNIKMTDKSFKNLAKFTYLEIELTYQNYTLGDVKAKSSLGNSCYSYIQTVSSFLLSKNVKIQIYRTTVLLTVLYGSETRSLT
jgi:hypothetical protein